MCNKNILGNINGYPLDNQQLKAATSNNKYSMIIAGAGSGKSTTIIGKIKYLIEIKKVNPDEILCISFTNESVSSLKESIKKNCGTEIPVLTFHKLAYQILKNNNTNLSLAPPNYLNFVVDEFFLKEDNFLAINNTFKFIKNKFHKKTWEEYLKIIKSRDFVDFKNIIINFLNLYLVQNSSIDKLTCIFANSKHTKDIAFLKLVIAIYRTYEIEKDSQGLIDYNDMINRATQIINKGGKIPKYKFLIIDEFQDTSIIRFELITAILKWNNSSLTIVGDDYQSIYQFSGCNLDIFLNFNKFFKNAEILKIENTYRNSQDLIDVAGSFITKNPLQIKKNLKSSKKYNKPIKVIYEKPLILKKLLYSLNAFNNLKILILGRNSFDLKKYIDNDFVIDNKGNINLKNCDNHIRYLTVHKSKGLEADIVIVVNLIDDKFGFPNKIENNKFLNLLTPQDNYPFEEERRLFYVALTRTKNEVYLLTQKNNSSIFVKELLKDYKKYIEIYKIK